MKKLAFLLVLTLTLFAFTSCENDGAIKLSGTSWVATVTVDTQTVTSTIKFTDSQNVTVTSAIGSVSQSVSGTYVYTHPTIAVTIDGDVTNLTVADSKHITITEEGTTYTYTKK